MPDYPFYWLNGEILSSDKALSPYDRGALLGDGVFETIRLTPYGRTWSATHLARHYARLVQGCQLLRLPVPEYDRIVTAIQTLVRGNLAGAISEPQALSLRLTYTHGAGSRGLTPPENPHPTLLLTLSSLPATQNPPVKLFISQDYRRDETSPLCKVKSLSFLPFLLARYEARDHDADDALLCNHAGHLVEASAANFLAVINGELVTPPIMDGALPGISRARLLEAGLCAEAPLIAQDFVVGRQKLEAAWLVTALHLTPVCALNRQIIGVDQTRHTRLWQFLFAD